MIDNHIHYKTDTATRNSMDTTYHKRMVVHTQNEFRWFHMSFGCQKRVRLAIALQENMRDKKNKNKSSSLSIGIQYNFTLVQLYFCP